MPKNTIFSVPSIGAASPLLLLYVFPLISFLSMVYVFNLLIFGIFDSHFYAVKPLR